MKKTKENKAITLVALVITIVILLILAGISVAQLTRNGLFEKTKLAREKQENTQEYENSTLTSYEELISEYISNSRAVGDMTIEELRSFVETIIESKSGQSSAGDYVPAGTVIAYYSKNAPEGYLSCYGTEYSISQYPKLAEIVKNTKGDYGTETEGKFKVPDLRG